MAKSSLLGSCEITMNYVIKRLSKLEGENKGYIVVSEIANDILVAVEERKNFILRTVFSLL